MTSAEILNSALTIVAIIAGPLLAVWQTRRTDRAKEERDRRLWVFRALMGTRGIRLSNDHVTALNLVVVEYYDSPDVVHAFKAYVQHLYRDLPRVDDQKTFFEEREDLFTNLLRQMGETLGYKLDGRELGRLAYAPIGWAHDEDRQRRLQNLEIDLLEGKRSLPVTVVASKADYNPFPPPPKP